MFSLSSQLAMPGNTREAYHESQHSVLNDPKNTTSAFSHHHCGHQGVPLNYVIALVSTGHFHPQPPVCQGTDLQGEPYHSYFLVLPTSLLPSNRQINIHRAGEETEPMDRLRAVFKFTLRMSSLPKVTLGLHADALPGCLPCAPGNTDPTSSGVLFCLNLGPPGAPNFHQNQWQDKENFNPTASVATKEN